MNEDGVWGQHVVLDLSGCPKEKIANGDNILAWGQALIKAIDMVAYGKPMLEHFATHQQKTAGYTYVQLIETSNICAHFAENLGEVYIDIFSCRDFDTKLAKQLTQEFFTPKVCHLRDFYRGGEFKEKI